MKPISNIDTQHDRQWYMYRKVRNDASKEIIIEQPCSFREALEKAYREHELIRENDKRRDKI